MIKNESIQVLEKKYNENKLSHVFLIETNDKQSALKDVLEFCKLVNCPENYLSPCTKCNLCHLIENDSLPSLKIIYPDGQAIKKSQMEELKSDFASIPYLSKYNIYIIQDAEKFNASSANTMLKFIEEPEKNIIGFLITNNKENVINTIKSRCEIIKANYSEKVECFIDEKVQNLAEEYLYKLEVEKEELIVYNKDILDEKLEKEEYIQLFQTLLDFYLSLLNGKRKFVKLKDNLQLNRETILQRVYLVNEVIERLNYNVNMNLLLDYFVLSLED